MSGERPKGWKGREVEFVTEYEGGPIWAYFAGEIAARNTAAERMGRRPPYHPTGQHLQHPVYPDVSGPEWREETAR